MNCEIPKAIVAGFSATWSTAVSSDYPSSTHTLQFVLRKDDGSTELKLTSTATGITGWETTIFPAQSATLTAGVYQVFGYITDDATGGMNTKLIASQATLTVTSNPLDDNSGDRRTFYRRMVDKLRTALESLASKSLSSVSVNGKNYTQRSLSELRQELSRFEQLLAAEESAQSGCEGAGKVYVRFRTPGG